MTRPLPLMLVLVALGSVLALSVPGVRAHSTATPRTPRADFSVTGTFEATIYRGPDAGLSVRGTIHLRSQAASGLTSGRVLRTHGSTVSVVGRIRGGGVNLFFDLGHGRHIFAVGTAVFDPKSQRATLGGPLVGPRHGDSGDWAEAMTPSSMTTSSSDPNAYAHQYYNTFGYVPAKASSPSTT